MNRITIMGNLGRDPELRRTPGGKSVCEFSVATTEKWNGETKTEWHNVTAWDKQADIIAQHFFKGSKILVEGKQTTQTWEKDGQRQSKGTIVLRDFYFVDSKSNQQQQQPNDNGNYENAPQQPQLPIDDELPF